MILVLLAVQEIAPGLVTLCFDVLQHYPAIAFARDPEQF